jgi:hypothetical protein
MNSFQLVLFVFVLPATLFLVIVGPLYIGICGSLYFFYNMKDISSYIYRPQYVLGMQESLYKYWLANKASLTIADFIVPVYGPVLLGIIVSLFMVYRLIQFVRNMSRVE